MIHCVAVDDEPLALDYLEDNIRQVPFLNLIKKCRTAIDAAEVLQNHNVDLLFLDIQMPGITGLQFVRSLKTKPMVIFITAYKKYALEGYELDVIDYLLKPVSLNRFVKAVNKASEYHQLKAGMQNESKKEFIYVYSEYSLVKISISQITYIEGLKDYVKIWHDAAQRPVITRLSIKALEKRLPKSTFIRIHKSYVISVEKLKSIRNSRVLVGDKEIPLSEHYKEPFFNLIDKNGIRF